MTTCACDACGQPAAGSEHCGFCTENCYPKGVLGTRAVRIALSPDSRAELHARARGETVIPVIDPREIARETGRRLVDHAMEAAKPMANQAIRAGFKFLQKKLIKT